MAAARHQGIGQNDGVLPPIPSAVNGGNEIMPDGATSSGQGGDQATNGDETLSSTTMTIELKQTFQSANTASLWLFDPSLQVRLLLEFSVRGASESLMASRMLKPMFEHMAAGARLERR